MGDTVNISEPNYISLYQTGELARRAERLEARLGKCDICPRVCGANRLEKPSGFCRSGRLPVVASVCAHRGEEPVLSGVKGSGTIFFAGCNMRCVFCQNHQISQSRGSRLHEVMDFRGLADKMLYLQDELGCHNINFVSPSHFVPAIVRALLEAVPRGLRVPLVYNTGGYDSLETLRELDGIISIYLPDLRYADNSAAARFSLTPDYVPHVRAAIKEMYRQVGDLVINEAGVARQGLIIRHLILPNGIAGSADSLAWLASEVSPTVTLSIMAQYMPVYRASEYPELSRRITPAEYRAVVELLSRLGLENGWLQELEASEHYLPDFERNDPFIASERA